MADTSPIAEAQELQKMVVSYAKQETLDPLKSLGRYLGLGLGGAFMIFMGVTFVGVGVLRYLQTLEIFGFAGSSPETKVIQEQSANWSSTIPYLAAILVLCLALAAIYRGLVRAKESVKQ